MKILHTSDWHLGRQLYGRKRYDEFAAFLDWLADLIRQQQIDILLVAGDIFDTSTPSNRAQELYYRFLGRVAKSSCRHIVVTAGNHDSPTFLDAPRDLLRFLNVYIVGEMAGLPEDEVIILRDSRDIPEAIVCAVPYLRDKDIRTVEAGESSDDKNLKLIAGLRNHYAEVCAIAAQKQLELGDIPIIAMGHLFAAAGKTVEGDGVRELYVGTLAHIGADAFPPCIDYLALGHLHIPQTVGGFEHLRYSGSPIPMGYGEAYQAKKIVLIEFAGRTPSIQEIAVPCFQPLERVSGTLAEIRSRIDELQDQDSKAWLEIEYTGQDIVGNLRELIDESLAGTLMECQRVKNKAKIDQVMSRIDDDETLDDLNVDDVFARCLDKYNVPAEQRSELVLSYQEIIRSIHEADENAE